jgi:hypothetical protein
MNQDEFDFLILRYLDGLATEDECMQFSRVMLNQAEARQAFWRLAEVHGLASEAFLVSQGVFLEDADNNVRTQEFVEVTPMPKRSESDVASSERNNVLFSTWASTAAVSCTILIGLLAWQTAIDSSATGKYHAELQEATVARVVESRSALLFNEERTLRAGQSLGAERVVMAAGVLEIALMNGISFVVEGPCDFELASNKQVILHRGQAVVHVPNGLKAFRFDTDIVRVVDASNEFAIDAKNENSTVIQVYDGIVQVRGDKYSTVEIPSQISAGKAVRYTSLQNTQPEIVEFLPEKFIRKLSKDKAIELYDESSIAHFNQPVHEAIAVWRRRSPIDVDGKLDDWPAVEGFHSVWDKSRDGREYVIGRMMYDEEKLYISAHVGDPFPMMNITAADTDADLAWRGGGLQIRLWAERQIEWPADLNSPEYYLMRSIPVERTDQAKVKNQRVAHLNLWYHAPSKRSCLLVAYGMEFKHVNDRVNPPNFEGTFRRDEDGRGYVAEYAIPWTLLNASGDPPQSGDRIPLTWTTHWSDPSGRLWRGQMNELRNANEPSRLASWERAATWGRAELE